MRHANIVSEDSPSLRIALITETYPPEINGVAMTLKRMVNGLLERGHRIQLVRPRQGEDDWARSGPNLEELLTNGWTVPRYESLRFGFPAKVELIRSWERERPDLVHVATEGPLGWSAVSAARKLRIPVASDFHTNFDHYSRHYGVGWMRRPVSAYLRTFHNRTALTFVPTSEMAGELRAQGYRDVDVVARGVDTDLYSPARRSDALRAEWGVQGEEPIVLSVGRLAPEKNLMLVVQAFRAIRDEVPDARLVFVGDGPMRESLTQAYPEAVFAGMRSGEDLASHYASADLFLFPSLTETFGNVTLEAMASGLCVLGYRYAAAAEVISDGINGLHVECDDERAFIAAACRAATCEELRNRLRAGARDRSMTLDWEQINDRFEAALLGVWRHSLKSVGCATSGREVVPR